jgi:N-sulfoglucosamine sulfohydrolase
VNFNDPHHPWDTGKNPPDPASVHVPGFLPDLPGVRADLSAYEGEIEHADGDVQTVLDIIKERAGLENTLIIFMGDNGMAFPSGKGCLHDAGLNVPLLAWWPGVIKPGGESRALVSGEDIAPTCLEVAGVPVPDFISGVTFLPALQGKSFDGRKYIFGERGPHGAATFDEHTTSNGVDYSRCVRSARYKLIYNVTPNIVYAPVDSTGNPSWKEMVQAHQERTLATEFETLYFTSPRPVYELYDLIVDFDYLPLPISGNPKKVQPNKPKVDRNKLFDQLDVNHDGKLSFEEFADHRDPAEAAAWFQARDRDGDGFLSREEFVTQDVPKPPTSEKK